MKYWKIENPDGSTNSVMANSHDKPVKDAVEIEKAAYDSFIAALGKPVNTTRVLEPEVDHLVEWAKTMGYVPPPTAGVIHNG